MYGQMTAGSWIYIGSQGIVQGTYETFVEAGRQHFGGDLAGQVDPHRRPRRHGRRAAAGGDDGRRLRRSPSNASRRRIDFRLRTRYLDKQADDLDEALGAASRSTREEARAVSDRRCSATPPRSCPNSRSAKAGTGSPDLRDRPDLARTTRSTATCPTGWTVPNGRPR